MLEKSKPSPPAIAAAGASLYLVQCRVSRELSEELARQAKRLKISVEDVIRCRLSQSWYTSALYVAQHPSPN